MPCSHWKVFPKVSLGCSVAVSADENTVYISVATGDEELLPQCNLNLLGFSLDGVKWAERLLQVWFHVAEQDLHLCFAEVHREQTLVHIKSLSYPNAACLDSTWLLPEFQEGAAALLHWALSRHRHFGDKEWEPPNYPSGLKFSSIKKFI